MDGRIFLRITPSVTRVTRVMGGSSDNLSSAETGATTTDR